MTGAERILAAVTGATPDRTPAMPVLLMQGARLLGLPLSRYFGEPGRIADGQLALLERFDADACFAFPHIVQDVLPWGAEIDLHDDGPPSVRGMVLAGREAIGALRPPDPLAHPYTRATIETARRLRREVGGDRLIVGAVIGPFSLPSMLMGTRRFLELLIDPSPEARSLLGRLLACTGDYATRFAQAQLDAGCDIVVVAEGIASASILDERAFLDHALPAIRAFVRRVRGPVAIEPVGLALPFLHHLRDVGAIAILVGSEDGLAASRRALGASGPALIGNLNNLRLLRQTPDRVRFEARRAIVTAGPRFVLANQGPEIPVDVADDVIDALVQAPRAA